MYEVIKEWVLTTIVIAIIVAVLMLGGVLLTGMFITACFGLLICLTYVTLTDMGRWVSSLFPSSETRRERGRKRDVDGA